jgi:hypothetical protein
MRDRGKIEKDKESKSRETNYLSTRLNIHLASTRMTEAQSFKYRQVCYRNTMLGVCDLG